ncbi:hypothetical protein AB0E08_05100 [Streptomyces sp. NPDC048281]|uniref:hypothetical protein n=1 Tax=Streptomyces sp. NPDC048281 TaxID=3154715 RepID=UPI0034475312
MKNTARTRILDQLKTDQAATNAAGLGDANSDAYYELVTRIVSEAEDAEAAILEIVQLLKEHGRATSKCPVFPAWCTSAGEHDDHYSADFTILDTRGEEMLAAHVICNSGSTPIVGISGSDFAPDEARTKATELRWLADQVETLAAHAEGAAP